MYHTTQNIMRLYVVKLENNKYFIFRRDKEDDYEQISVEIQLLYDFVRKYKPVEIIEVVEIEDELDIDKHVKNYMLFYGIENVRGGTYVDEILPEYLVKTLRSEFTIFNLDNDSNAVTDPNAVTDTSAVTDPNAQTNTNAVSEIIEKYGNMTLDERKLEKNSLVKEYEFYAETKRLYNEYKFSPLNTTTNATTIGPPTLDILDWLLRFIDYRWYDTSKIMDETKEIYEDALTQLRFISQTYFKITDHVDYEMTIFLHKPEFVFDSFFYHRHDMSNYEEQYITAFQVLKTFRSMCFRITNRLDEFEFDMSGYPKNFENYAEMVLNYMDILETTEN